MTIATATRPRNEGTSDRRFPRRRWSRCLSASDGSRRVAFESFGPLLDVSRTIRWSSLKVFGLFAASLAWQKPARLRSSRPAVGGHFSRDRRWGSPVSSAARGGRRSRSSIRAGAARSSCLRALRRRVDQRPVPIHLVFRVSPAFDIGWLVPSPRSR